VCWYSGAVDWRNFFEGIFYSLLPKEYWRSWRPSSTVDFARSAITSGLIECGGFLYLLVYGYFHFLAVRTHQLQAVEGANEGTQLYFFSVLTVEYAFHPLSLLALCLSGEGALRSWAAFFTDEIVPSLPIKLAALTQAWLKMRRMEKSIGRREWRTTYRFLPNGQRTVGAFQLPWRWKMSFTKLCVWKRVRSLAHLYTSCGGCSPEL
jgi:hypothetical protein